MTTQELSQLNYRLSRIESYNMRTAHEAIDYFFEAYTIEDARHLVHELYYRALMSYESEETDLEKPFTKYHFYTYLDMMLEAAWLINNDRKRRQLKNDKKGNET